MAGTGAGQFHGSESFFSAGSHVFNGVGVGAWVALGVARPRLKTNWVLALGISMRGMAAVPVLQALRRVINNQFCLNSSGSAFTNCAGL